MTPGVCGSFLGRNGTSGGPVIACPFGENIFHRPFVMASALDAGSGDAFTGRTSKLRGKETAPQPNRVGFKLYLNMTMF